MTKLAIYFSKMKKTYYKSLIMNLVKFHHDFNHDFHATKVFLSDKNRIQSVKLTRLGSITLIELPLSKNFL